MIDLHRFGDYFRSYEWEAKHALFGYPPDRYPDFRWIADLERRFAWLRAEPSRAGNRNSGLYLLKDMIQWGGSQNGRLQKFEDSLGESCLYEDMNDVLLNLASPRLAITAALKLPGFGLTYASKLLRFLDPIRYGALDNRLRAAFEKASENERRLAQFPTIREKNSSRVAGYEWFCGFVDQIVSDLEAAVLMRPACHLAPAQTTTQWRAADVEMALFQWAKQFNVPDEGPEPEEQIPSHEVKAEIRGNSRVTRKDVENALGRLASDDHRFSVPGGASPTADRGFTASDIDRNHRRIEKEIGEGARRAGLPENPRDRDKSD